MVSYRAQVGASLEVLAEGLAPFVDRLMTRHYPDEDWIITAATKLGKREPVLASPTDPQFQLEVMVRWWGPVFSRALSTDTRTTVQELRRARNDWAHIDDTHPIDFEYALRIHGLAEDLLDEIGSPLADSLARLANELQRSEVAGRAQERGVTESEVLLEQLRALQQEREQLSMQLEDAEETARSAVGRQRAAARQLAELQAQYAAVSGLRERYRELQTQLSTMLPETDASDPTGDRLALDDAARAFQQLQETSNRLHRELATTRAQLANIDPFDTDAGKRWLMLVAALIMVLGVTIFVVARSAST
jgi:hypothetical protein